MRIGYEGEYYLMKKFTSLQRPGYYAVRTPGSGTGKTFKPDLLVVEAGELYAIEVKSTNRDSIYVRPEQLERLRRFAELFRVKCPHCEKEFGPRPVLAVRFLGKGWVFREVRDSSDIHISVGGAGGSAEERAKEYSTLENYYASEREKSSHRGGHERGRPGNGSALRRARRQTSAGSEEDAALAGIDLRNSGEGRRSHTSKSRPV